MRTSYIAILGMLAAPMFVSAAKPAPDAASLPSSAPAGTSQPAGTDLEARILHEIRTLPYYSVFDDLSFRVDGGTVTLSGQVTRPVLKTDAETVVKHLAGVAKVDNQIEVLPLSDFDRQIRMRAYFAIYGFGPLERYGAGTHPSIHILVKDGHITLKGVVDSEPDRSLAFIRANQVPGVFSVTNELSVDKHS